MIGLPSSFLTRPIAHRGLHDAACGRVENSAAAITAAINSGYGIEIDVQLSKDGTAIVFHDYHLDRLTAHSGTVAEKSEHELSQATLAGSQDTIPTLNQMLALISGQVPLLIEIKDQDGDLGNNVGELEAAVAHTLQSYKGHIAVMSFNPNAVAVFAKLQPQIPVGLVTDSFSAEDWPTLSACMREHLSKISDFDRTG
ncbi:MAG: glycerophosphoryl diester phosphodiesterase, partial [Planktomarina sp.]